jgi:hypothetical protein
MQGDWLCYLADVNTSKIGEYEVWYKAYDSLYSPGTCTGYKSLINFIVEDKTKPTITTISDIYRIKRGQEYDLSKNYIAYDNYELKEVKEVGTIDINQIGIYDIKVVATDTSNNQTVEEFQVEVYEDSYPVISCLIPGDTITIPLNGDYDISSIFTAMDALDGDITSKIHYPSIKKDAVMEYPYTVSVMNQAGLTAEYTITIKIEDDEAPIIELTDTNVLLDYTIDIDSFDFLKYVKNITDNSIVDYDNLRIRHTLENQVGNYMIYYTYSDGIHTVEESISVTMISYDKPEIYVDDIEIYVNSTVDLTDYITITDASDPYVSNSIEIFDDQVNYAKEGTYYAEVYCINSSGLSETKRFKVVVKDSSIFSNSNIGLIIPLILSVTIALGLGVFLFVYFFLKKRKSK